MPYRPDANPARRSAIADPSGMQLPEPWGRGMPPSYRGRTAEEVTNVPTADEQLAIIAAAKGRPAVPEAPAAPAPAAIPDKWGDDPRRDMPAFQKFMSDMANEKRDRELKAMGIESDMARTMYSSDAAYDAARARDSRLATDQEYTKYLMENLTGPMGVQFARDFEATTGTPAQAALLEHVANARERELQYRRSFPQRNLGKNKEAIMELIDRLYAGGEEKQYAKGGEVSSSQWFNQMFGDQKPAPEPQDKRTAREKQMQQNKDLINEMLGVKKRYGYADGGEVEFELDMAGPMAEGDVAGMDSGDYVIPVEAVRFFGTKFFNDLIAKAMDAED